MKFSIQITSFILSMMVGSVASMTKEEACTAANLECMNEGQCDFVDGYGAIDHSNGDPDDIFEVHCVCTEDWQGSLCQTPVDHALKLSCEAAGLTHACMNGGSCQFVNEDGDIDHSNNGDPNSANEVHCECAEGWAGSTCNLPANRCGESTIFCFNHGSCKSVNVDYADGAKGTTFECDCSTANNVAENGNSNLFSGQYCEIGAAKLCSSNSLIEAAKNHAFCTSHGTCAKDESDVSVCLCEPGWEGQHCQFAEGTLPPKGSSGDSSSSSGDEVSAAAVLLIVALCILFVGLSVYAVSSHFRKKAMNSMRPGKDLELEPDGTDVKVSIETAATKEDAEII
mmetsp:Transcript_26241/g.40676  ORF Transcript_26241/g.40676 Transcript_26241/m.40676 type:complete len:340 (-) Transcript_26241:248-1267(-)|eukprot:CAMPEP_0196803012 /NCGR_PEP_ID=MMETSP1362-20130617/2479_1 /TAXON_ID=163516 /ORGANISM="Leptocylindrus danicus, Strain CCMP1856" /LENGTH=339 /DNA_ID=CAMNT_0042174433 /DNA_START=65 /DNA_END=1084 /DNA_ORIENTATION=+